MGAEMQEILDGLEALKDSEVYKRINEIAKGDYQSVDEEQTIDRMKYNFRNPRRLMEETLLKKGIINNLLSHPSLKFGDTVVYRDVELTSGFIVVIYSAYSGGKLSMDVIKKADKIYGLTLNYLDSFDSVKKDFHVSRYFYDKISKLRWSKEAKVSLKKIGKVENIVNLKVEGLSSTLTTSFMSSYKLFSAASAVAAGRDVILSEDVYRAYRTILKLINTDLTRIPLPPDKTDEEIDAELDSLGSYKGKTYREIADEMYASALKDFNLNE